MHRSNRQKLAHKLNYEKHMIRVCRKNSSAQDCKCLIGACNHATKYIISEIENINIDLPIDMHASESKNFIIILLLCNREL